MEIIGFAGPEAVDEDVREAGRDGEEYCGRALSEGRLRSEKDAREEGTPACRNVSVITLDHQRVESSGGFDSLP